MPVTGQQYAPPVLGGGDARRPQRTRLILRHWPDAPGVVATLERPRDDLLAERRCEGDDAGASFEQAAGPFTTYRRDVVPVDGDTGRTWRETTRYRLSIPWFGWLFALPVRAALARRGAALTHTDHGTMPPTPWWAPPDRLDPRAISVLGLMAAASMVSAFVSTLFTQTVNFAADDFGVGDVGVGVAGSIVRAGILLVLPVAVLADRRGRRRVVVAMAFAAPLVTACGALAPTFPLLVATQAIGRPLGLALDFLIAVVAAEEMPRNCRAYAVSLLAMASGLGAGVAVFALPLADLSPGSWRWVYVVALVWLVVAVDIARRLPETRRFERPHVVAPPIDRSRFAVLAAVAIMANFFVAPASLFQNGYLEDTRGFSAATIAVFTIVTATPAGIGLILGGRIADIDGRRRIIAIGVPLATGLVVLSYTFGGPGMWLSVFLAGILTGVTVPALAVYRTELFPTGNRSRAAGLLTTCALLGGIVGLLLMGSLLDRGWPHGQVVGLLALAQVGVVIVVLRWYPETAHRELEELNPEDRLASAPTARGCRPSDVAG
ncbi:MAG: MFS transporter [Ilumatobacteraceae bacterium]